MLKQFESIRLTVVDFLGVFLPGVVWTILFLTAEKMMYPNQSLVTPVSVSVALSYSKGYDAASYVGLSVASLLFGYVNMALSTKPAQFVSNFLPNIFSYVREKTGCDHCKVDSDAEGADRKDGQGQKTDKRGKSKRSFSQIAGDNEFPYKNEFNKKPYFKTIEEFVLSEIGCKRLEEISSSSSYQPFDTCKRLLRLHAPVLSEEAERREAQVRMLASLLLASVFNLLLAIMALLSNLGVSQVITNYFPAYTNKLCGTGGILFPWLIISIFITYLIGTTFRTRRRREVEDVYLCTLIVYRLKEKEKCSPHRAEPGENGDSGASSSWGRVKFWRIPISRINWLVFGRKP